jgi:hypothetical protein
MYGAGSTLVAAALATSLSRGGPLRGAAAALGELEMLSLPSKVELSMLKTTFRGKICPERSRTPLFI